MQHETEALHLADPGVRHAAGVVLPSNVAPMRVA
jgi:hypothetical protein